MPTNRPLAEVHTLGIFLAAIGASDYRRALRRPADCAGVKVFLVENAPQVRERLRSLIGVIRDVEIVGETGSAADAIAGILQTAPDLVLLDIHLDHGNGFDVLRALRKQAPAIVCYMLSNFPSATYRAVAERLGARAFFDKSRDLERLIGVIVAQSAP